MITTISQEALYEFYEKFVLLQFGIKDEQVIWDYSEVLEPDEDAHYFHINKASYVLIFEDYIGLAAIERYIIEHINLQSKEFTYINPISHSENGVSWSLRFEPPYQHCHNISGSFTLIKLEE